MTKSSKILSLVISLILVLAVVIPVTDASAAETPKESIVIIHTNDVHGAIDGYAKVAQLKKDAEASGAYVLLMDAGDFLQGSVMVSDSKGASAIELMNAAGYDVVTMGNHEFDYGFDVLEKNIDNLDSEFVVATVKRDGQELFSTHTVFTSPDGTKIGVFGLNTPETKAKSNPDLVEGYDFADEDELIVIAQTQVEELKEEGCDIIVALAHLGIDASSNGHRSVDVLNAVDGIDILIDGHSHSTLDDIDALEENITSTACLTSTGTKLANIGYITIDKKGASFDIQASLIPTEGLEEDPDVAALAQKINADLDAKYGKVFAKSKVELDGVKEHVRAGETNLGDLITDAMVWKCQNEGLKADAALINSGSIRASIPTGKATKKDILNVLPFSNTLFLISVKGSELLEALESSMCIAPDVAGAYPQISGIELDLDVTQEFDMGEPYGDSAYCRPASIKRVKIKSVAGKPFDPDAVYSIAVNDFMASGGDAYYVLSNAELKYDLGFDLAETVIEYVRTELGGVIRKEYAKSAERVHVISEASESVTLPQNYKIQKGDNLWSLAERFYGAGKYYKRIFSANKNVIKDPDKIYYDEVIIIPEIKIQ